MSTSGPYQKVWVEREGNDEVWEAEEPYAMTMVHHLWRKKKKPTGPSDIPVTQ